MNLLVVTSWCLAFSVAAGNVLDIADIRLVNGSGPYGGLVEIQINGIWGTVCDDSFDFNDATVMCRMMNLKASTYMNGVLYGQSKGPIFALKFECTGYETHIKSCPYVSNETCTNARGIGIICSECPQIGIINGNATDISADGTVLSAMCNIGFASNTLTSTCINEAWSPPSIICTCDHNIKDIRLVNGVGLYDGRVEFLLNGTWGTLCGTYISWRASQTVCRSLFGSSARYISYSTTSTNYGPGKGSIYIEKLECGTSSTSVCECSYSLGVSCADHTRDVAVACSPDDYVNITDVRLVNGTGPYDGRVEVNAYGHWGTVCNRYINMYNAQTICSTLNSSFAVYFTKSVYGEGTGPVLIRSLYCRDRNHIKNCNVYPPYRPYCTHEYDLSIVCISCGQPAIYNGEVFSFNYTELTVRCHEGFFPNYITMRCLDNGTWIEDKRCTSFNEISFWDAGFFTYNSSMFYADCSYYKTYLGRLNLTYDNVTQTWVTEGECKEYGYPLYVSNVRLADGPKPSEGRVEVKSLNTWGTICDDDFGISEANLICNMAGYTRALSFHTGAFYGEGKGPIFIDNLDCKDTATDFTDCTYKTFDNCTHADDISVVCTDCGDPTPKNGFVNTSSTTYQTVVHVSCEYGYRLIGEDDIICQTNGTWSNLSVCKLIDCDDPTPVHGSSNSSVTTNGTVVLIECETGYSLTGESIITCQADETWTDIPSCVITEEADDDPYTIVIILAVCMGILVVTNVGLILVIVRLKRKENSKTGTATDTDRSHDTPSNIYQTGTERISETNLYESLGEQVDEQISMGQLDFVKLKPNERKQKPGHHTKQTEEEHCYHNVNF